MHLVICLSVCQSVNQLVSLLAMHVVCLCQSVCWQHILCLLYIILTISLNFINVCSWRIYLQSRSFGRSRLGQTILLEVSVVNECNSKDVSHDIFKTSVGRADPKLDYTFIHSDHNLHCLQKAVQSWSPWSPLLFKVGPVLWDLASSC